MKKWFIVFMTTAVLLLGIVGYLVFYSLKIKAEQERIYTFLIDTHHAPGERVAVYVLFYHYPENFFLVYHVPEKLAIAHPNKRLRDTTPFLQAYGLSQRALKKALQKYYDITPDFTFTVSLEDSQNLIQDLGGTSFFNLYAEHLPKGIVFIDEFNYLPFLQSITDDERVSETALSIWYTLLNHQLTQSIAQPNLKNHFISSLAQLPSNINQQTLTRLFSPLIEKEGEMYFYLLRSNLVTRKQGDEIFFLPLENGEYDKQKISEKLISFKERQVIYEQFPITMQIKNTTSIKRLATRTAGVLRVKKIDVKEYLNSPIPLQKSVLLDFSHSPIKKDYIKKITQVEQVHSLFDYRDNFDFSLYIANDFYGIQYIKNP